MNTKSVTLVVTFQARPGKEAGCINYDLHISPDDSTKLLFYENWTSKAHLDAHGQTPHIQNLRARLNEFCVEPPEIAFWEKIG